MTIPSDQDLSAAVPLLRTAARKLIEFQDALRAIESLLGIECNADQFDQHVLANCIRPEDADDLSEVEVLDLFHAATDAEDEA